MPKCIVADDSKVIRLVISKILQSFGFEAIDAEDGESVLELYLSSKEDVSLIIMDQNLPLLDGLDVLRMIRQNENIIQPSILLMASTFDEYRVAEAIESGVDDYIIKPFDEDILSSKLEILGLI